MEENGLTISMEAEKKKKKKKKKDVYKFINEFLKCLKMRTQRGHTQSRLERRERLFPASNAILIASESFADNIVFHTLGNFSGRCKMLKKKKCWNSLAAAHQTTRKC